MPHRLSTCWSNRALKVDSHCGWESPPGHCPCWVNVLLWWRFHCIFTVSVVMMRKGIGCCRGRPCWRLMSSIQHSRCRTGLLVTKIVEFSQMEAFQCSIMCHCIGMPSPVLPHRLPSTRIVALNYPLCAYAILSTSCWATAERTVTTSVIICSTSPEESDFRLF